MNTILEKRNQFAENEVTDFLIQTLNPENTDDVRMMAHKIVQEIDWENESLMHKGLCWITLNYLKQHRLIA